MLTNSYTQYFLNQNPINMVNPKIPDKVPEKNKHVEAVNSHSTLSLSVFTKSSNAGKAFASISASLQVPHTGYASTANAGYEIPRKQTSIR